MDLLFKFFSTIFVGGFIGWVTNYLAIKLLFRPHKEINFFFFKIQGLIPKRRDEIIEQISDVIEKELINIKDVFGELIDNDLSDDLVNQIVEKLVGKSVIEKMMDDITIFKFLPNAFNIKDKIVEVVQSKVKETIIENKDEIIVTFFNYAQENISLKKIMIEKMKTFSLNDIENIIFSISKKELKHIEIIGMILGALIAVYQFIILLFI